MSKKLWLLDVDGTVVKPHTNEVLEGVREWIATLDPDQNLFAFVTNNGQVGLRFWIESAGGFGKTDAEKAQSLADATEKYPTKFEAAIRIEEIGHDLFGDRFVWAQFLSFRYQSKAGNWSPTPYDATEAERIAWAYNDKDPSTKLEVTEDDLPNAWRKDRRKPAPGMLLDAMGHFVGHFTEVAMIGDSADDKAAAEAAGVIYHYAREFFNK